MQENDFEKRVEDKLAALKLSPSEGVWAAVEAELHKRKKRRGGFFILLLGGLGLAGYTGYTLLDRPAETSLTHEQNLPVSNQRNDPAVKNNRGNSSGTDHENKKDGITDEVKMNKDEGTTSMLPAKDEARQTDTKVPGRSALAQKERIILKDRADQKFYNKKEKTVHPATVVQNEVAVVKRNNQNKEGANDGTVKPGQQKNIAGQNDQPAVKKSNDLPGDDGNNKRDEPVKEDTLRVADTVTAYAAVDSAATDLVIEESAQFKKIAARKIKWGLDLSGGATFSRHEVLSVVNNGRVSAERAYFNVNAPGVAGTNPGGIVPPSSVSAGPAFKAGVFVEMSLSGRSSVTAGLRYAYFSETMKVGHYRDTFYVSNAYSPTAITNGVYGPARQKTFNNAYHFIELPLSYHLLLSKPRKMQVIWDAGVIASYLLHTNSLAYDTAAGGVYYKQPGVVSRMHFSVHTGIAFRFAAKKNFAWSVGPELALDMTRLMKQDIFTRERYLFYGGIAAKIILPSLKK